MPINQKNLYVAAVFVNIWLIREVDNPSDWGIVIFKSITVCGTTVINGKRCSAQDTLFL